MQASSASKWPALAALGLLVAAGALVFCQDNTRLLSGRSTTRGAIYIYTNTWRTETCPSHTQNHKSNMPMKPTSAIWS